MSAPEEPIRLANEGSGASAAMRRALLEAKADLPAPERVEAMLARFPFPTAGGGEPSGGDAGGDAGGGGVDGATAPLQAGAKVGGATKLAAVAALVAASIGAAVLVMRSGPTSDLASTTVEASSDQAAPTRAASAEAVANTSSAPTPSVSSSAAASAPSARHAHASSSASVSPSASASPPSLMSEYEILKEAHAAKGSNPARTLELVNEHARAFPAGQLTQEREILRIDALLGLGRRSEAKALADAFRKANPNSAHARRLDSLFP